MTDVVTRAIKVEVEKLIRRNGGNFDPIPGDGELHRGPLPK